MVCLNDDSVAPAVGGCRIDFDFTIKFEQVFFSVIPAIVFAALSVTRLGYPERTAGPRSCSIPARWVGAIPLRRGRSELAMYFPLLFI